MVEMDRDGCGDRTHVTDDRPILTIYVMEHCRGCDRARRNAREVRSRFPEVRVDVVDLGQGDPPPPDVFSVPTYVLDGRVVSLGNPRFDTLMRWIAEHAGGRYGDDHEP